MCITMLCDLFLFVFVSLDVNLTGTFMCTKAVAPEMIKRGWGRIINLSSMLGIVGLEKRAPYTASKGALRHVR